MIYAIPCKEEAHELLTHLIGEVPNYEGDESYMLVDPTDSGKNRVVQWLELYNEDGTMYAIDDLVIVVM